MSGRLRDLTGWYLIGWYTLVLLMIALSMMTCNGCIASADVHTTGVNSASEHTFEITPSSQYAHTPPSNKSLWTCFDHAMNYSLHNPSWGLLLVSDHPQMLGMGHFLNYQIDYSDNSLIIHDEFLENDYRISGWQYDSCTFDYYHFYIDSERPTRWFNFQNKFHIRPNAEEVYRDWVLTR